VQTGEGGRREMEGEQRKETTKGGCRSEKDREAGRTRDKKEGMQIADCRRRQEEDSRREMQTGERRKEKMVQTGEGERRKKKE